MNNRKRQSFSIKHYRFTILTVWCLVCLAATLWLYRENRAFEQTQLLTTARMAIAKDIAFRSWAARHGGVYVPITETTPPNPWLDIAERDISTPSGRKLTLLNPAYMTRQIFENGGLSPGPLEHLTSLKPLRPENFPDSWEIRALKTFEAGAEESGESLVQNGRQVYRYMRPLVTEKACLPCHAQQGYREGMIRGGISITLRADDLSQAAQLNSRSHFAILAGIWLLGVLGIVYGFSRLAAAGAALMRERDNLNTVFNTLPTPLLLLDTDLNLLRINSTFRDYCADFHPASGDSGQPCGLLPPDAEIRQHRGASPRPCRPECIVDRLRRLVQNGAPRSGEVRLAEWAPTGEAREVWINYSSERVYFGEREYRLLSFMDISASRQMQNRLQEQAVLLEEEIEERNRAERELRLLNQAVNQSADAFYLLDEKQQFVFVNETACRTLGYSREELRNMTPLDIDPDMTAEQPPRPQQKFISSSLSEIFRARHRSRDGRIFPVEISASPCNYYGAEMSLTIARDISERIKLEEQLFQAQKMDAIGRLAGGVAHDFNNMLAVIQGHTEVALRKIDAEHRLFYHLTEIGNAATRSARLTSQLLGYSRKQPITPQILNLNQAMEGMLEMLRRLIGEHIELRWRPESTAAILKIDPSQVDQILVNLCVNARDAITGTGTLTIQTGPAVIDETYCAYHPETRPGAFIILTVSDTGCGMDRQILEKIFEPFFTTKEMGNGTGLGLATVYGIVRQNNGFINVYSEPRQGTTFRIYLPRHDTPPEPLPVETTERFQAPRGQTVLLVEDEPSNLEITRQMLESCGYRVLAADSPTEALRIAATEDSEIQLLLTDFIMPGMNGRDLAKNICTRRPQLRCLYMSGYPGDVINKNGLLDEGMAFLQKPFSLQTLAAKLLEVLPGRQKFTLVPCNI